MAASETDKIAMWSGVAGLTTFVGGYSFHEVIGKEYSPAKEVEWRQSFLGCHGGTAGVYILASGLGYSIGRWKITPEGMSAIGLGISLMLSDINDAAKWFKSAWGVLAILIAFIIGLIIGLIVRQLELSTENASGSVA